VSAAPAAPATIAAEPVGLDALASPFWRRHPAGAATLWLKGHVAPGAMAALTRAAAARPGEAEAALDAVLAETDGHYALVVAGPGWTYAAVDPVRSTPLFFARTGDTWRLDDRAERLRRRAGLGAGDIDADAALAVAMAGYTIDRATLYRGLDMLGPGERALFRPGLAPARARYFAYRPWRVSARDPAGLERDLEDLTLDIIRRMLASLDGRPLVVPLSAGYDSRLIVSAAKYLGHKDVRCFAYGRPGNFEAVASRAVAERLGYAWTFQPVDNESQRRFFAGADYARYLEEADSAAAVPFVQDLSAVAALKARGFIPPDAVIANGNSGDYISGNHVPKALTAPAPESSPEARRARITAALIDKHFSLWRALRTPEREARIGDLLWRSIAAGGGALGDPACDHGLYEYAEFQDRQCKYVITGQRIYEFHGHEWRLPLWDRPYLAFWESVPIAEKAGQALYSRMLHRANWAGAWSGIPLNRKTVRPRWLAAVRAAFRLAHAPFGRARWHRFERRYLLHFMEPWSGSAFVPYCRIARDTRGARHAVAWLAEAYLARHGLDWTGAPGP
jgi:asparagine synthase (glutamine-hydrolysing)